MTVHFILLTGGTGSRLNAETPKQFLKILGKPLMYHALSCLGGWNQLQPSHGGLICVGHPDHLSETEEAVDDLLHFFSFHSFVPGGKTRHDSTKNGLKAMLPHLSSHDLVFIHDGARPLVAAEELNRLKECFQQKGVEIASLALPVHETLVKSRKEGSLNLLHEVVSRENAHCVKTPQALKAGFAKRLVKEPTHEYMTDLLTWSAGRHRAVLVQSTAQNIKVTTEQDLILVEEWMN